jgi:hypothetical protein
MRLYEISSREARRRREARARAANTYAPHAERESRRRQADSSLSEGSRPRSARRLAVVSRQAKYRSRAAQSNVQRSRGSKITHIFNVNTDTLSLEHTHKGGNPTHARAHTRRDTKATCRDYSACASRLSSATAHTLRARSLCCVLIRRFVRARACVRAAVRSYGVD